MSVTGDGRSESVLARVGVLVLAAVFTFYSISAFVADSQASAGVRAVGLILTIGCVATFSALQFGLVRLRLARGIPLLAIACTFCSVALFVLFGSWITLGMALAALGLGIKGPRGAVLAIVVAVGCHGYLITQVPDLDRRTGIPVTNWVTAIVLYSVTRLFIVLQELRRTREHLARLQVDEERSRISRDLHDIMGRTLVAVSLRTETAMRFIDLDVDKCREQLDQLQSAISAGQAQLRALTSGPVITGLTSELETARRLFDRLGIRLGVETVPIADQSVDQIMAAVVREAVTNSLKHSRPQECRITVRRESLATVLSVVNDGVGDAVNASDSNPLARTRDGGGGTGLEDMRARVEALGGSFVAGPVDGRRFRVIARIPHSAPSAVTDHASLDPDEADAATRSSIRAGLGQLAEGTR